MKKIFIVEDDFTIQAQFFMCYFTVNWNLKTIKL